jgi:hypothetical protein
MPWIAVSLSGGGHRAALFGIGALLYLADVGRNAEVTSIASVSGGSITNGYLAQQIAYDQADSGEIHRAARGLATTIANDGSLVGPPPSLGVLLPMAVLLVARPRCT